MANDKKTIRKVLGVSVAVLGIVFAAASLISKTQMV